MAVFNNDTFNFSVRSTMRGHHQEKDNNETIRNENYLHYFIEHAPATAWQAGQLANLSAQSILTNAKERISKAAAAKKQQLANNGQFDEIAIFDSLLDGSAFEELNNLQITPAIPKFGDLLTQLKEIREDGLDKGKIDSFLQDLKNTILADLERQGKSAPSGSYKDFIYQAFGTGKLSSATMRRARASAKGSSKSSIAGRIIDSLLARKNEGFWRASETAYDRDFQMLTTEKRKLLAAVGALQDLASETSKSSLSSVGSVEVRHGTMRKGQKGDRVSGEALVDALYDKMERWLLYASACAAEETAKQTILKAAKETGEAFRQGDQQFEIQTSSGDLMWTTIKKTDPALQDFFKQASNRAFSRAFKQKRVSKSDVAWEIGEDRVAVTAGVSVKQYDSKSDIDLNGYFQKAGEINLQSGTPLLTLLAREAGLSSGQLHALYQIAVAHSLEGAEGSLDLLFETIINNAKMLALLDTLAGFTNTKDQVFFMIINDKPMTIESIIDKIMAQPNPSTLIKMAQQGKGTDDAALTRSTYLAMNNWLAPERDNPISAKIRSDALFKQVSQTMYKAKIRISLNWKAFV